jgi:hypothetical protein
VDRSDRRQSAAEIGVFAVELDGSIEAADPVERIPADGEIPTVEDGAGADDVVHDDVRRRRHERVVETNDDPANEVPVVKAVGAGDGDHRGVALETPLHSFEPLQRRTTVGVEIRQHVTDRTLPAGLAGNHQTLGRLVNDAHARYRRGDRRRAIRARVVDQDDFVGWARLGE